jgi:hypothetical protein
MKKKCAVFTIAKNESYFLPIWLKHFKQYFSNEDIYILDHQSTDGSTDNLDVVVAPVYNEKTFDHNWLVSQVQEAQQRLLERYECVLFCEADELVYTVDEDFNDVIDKFLSDDSAKFISVRSHELVQNIEDEAPISETDKIFENRNRWFHHKMYDKSLLSKVPLHWVVGFHDTTDYVKDFKYEMFLVHLHRVDFELMMKRHSDRATWNHKHDGGGLQNLTDDRDFLLNKYFKYTEGEELDFIPFKHKETLKHI